MFSSIYPKLSNKAECMHVLAPLMFLRKINVDQDHTALILQTLPMSYTLYTYSILLGTRKSAHRSLLVRQLHTLFVYHTPSILLFKMLGPPQYQDDPHKPAPAFGPPRKQNVVVAPRPRIRKPRRRRATFQTDYPIFLRWLSDWRQNHSQPVRAKSHTVL